MHRDYGHFRQALQSYEKAINASKNSSELSNLEAESLLGIGDLHRLKGDYKEALDNLAKPKGSIEKTNLRWSKRGLMGGRIHLHLHDQVCQGRKNIHTND